ncbi:MAG TPA: glycine betaine ABC transporter substrate-binding protein [Conexibacter sp.]
MPSRRLAPLLAVLALLTAAAGCGGSGSAGDGEPGAGAREPGADRPPVTLGTRTSSEQILLGQLYKQALEAQGFTVALKQNIGSAQIADEALRRGQIDLYPEDAEIGGGAEEQGFVRLAPTPFSNVQALAVLPQLARAHGLRAVGDLARIEAPRLGAQPEFLTDAPGLPDLERVYGLREVAFAPLTIGLQYDALEHGKLDVAVVSTTDGELQDGRFVVLADPRGLFGARHVAPIVSARVLAAEGPAFARTLDAVSRALTTPAMRELNAAVAIEGRSPADAAAEFLRDADLA